MGGLFSKPKLPKAVTETAKKTPPPMVDDTALAAAKRKSMAAQSARGGRQSTILTDMGDKLGGGM